MIGYSGFSVRLELTIFTWYSALNRYTVVISPYLLRGLVVLMGMPSEIFYSQNRYLLTYYKHGIPFQRIFKWVSCWMNCLGCITNDKKKGRKFTDKRKS